METTLKRCKWVEVVFPPFKSKVESQNREYEEVKRFFVSKDNDFENGRLTFETLLSNLYLWKSRGYKITFNYTYEYDVMDIYSGTYGTLRTNKMYKKNQIALGTYEVKACMVNLDNGSRVRGF